MTDVKANKIDRIVVWNQDRGWRKMADLESLRPVLEPRGVQLATTNIGVIDFANADDVFRAQVSSVAVRLRRDFSSILALIRAHAVLHQASRDTDDAGRIIAAADDYAVVRTLVADVISEGVGTTVSATVRDTVTAVAELASAEGVMVKVIADKLNLDKSNVSRRLHLAAEGGYLRNLEDKRGKPDRWVLGGPLPESVNLLPTPAQLAIPYTPLMPHLTCAVALLRRYLRKKTGRTR